LELSVFFNVRVFLFSNFLNSSIFALGMRSKINSSSSFTLAANRTRSPSDLARIIFISSYLVIREENCRFYSVNPVLHRSVMYELSSCSKSQSGQSFLLVVFSRRAAYYQSSLTVATEALFKESKRSVKNRLVLPGEF